MNGYLIRTMGFVACVAMLAATCSPQAAISAELQWGFDFTTGDVPTQNGGVIDNDGTFGASLNGQAAEGTPGYSPDIPTNTQFVTGTGSVDITRDMILTRSIETAGPTSGLGTNATLAAAGGMTVEVWVKRAQDAENSETIFDVGGGWYVLSLSNTSVIGISSTGANQHPSFDFPVSTADAINGKWTHLAMVYDIEPGVGDDLFSLFVNGTMVSQVAGTGNAAGTIDFAPNLDGAAGSNITFGTQAGSDGKRFLGLLYEPRVTLGVLTPSEFTIKPIPEPTTLALMAMSLFGVTSLRRGRRK